MSSDNKKEFTTQATSKAAGVEVTSDTIALPDAVSDAILSVKTDASCTGVVDVELEMSPDGTNWCPAVTRTVAANVVNIEPKIGNEEYVKLTPDTVDGVTEPKNKHARGGLNFDVNGAVVTPDGSGARDLMDQHIAVNKSFNYSQWFKTSEAPTTTYKPVLFRHGGYDNFENTKAVALTDNVTQNLCEDVNTVNRYTGRVIWGSGAGASTSFSPLPIVKRLAPTKEWTAIVFGKGGDTDSSADTFGNITWYAAGASGEYNYNLRGHIFNAKQEFDYRRIAYIQSGIYYVSGTSAAAGADVGPYLNTGNKTISSPANPITGPLMQVWSNSYDVSTHTRSVTLTVYNINLGVQVFTETFTVAGSAGMVSFWDGTATYSVDDLIFHTYPGYSNTFFINYMSDLTILDTAISTSDHSNYFDIIGGKIAPKDNSSASGVIAQYKFGDGPNDVVSGSMSVENLATNPDAAFTDLPMHSVIDNSTTTDITFQGQYISSLKTADLFTTTSNLSISGWFKTTDTGVLFSNTEGAAASGMKLDVNASDMTINFIATSAENITVNSDVNDGNWHHLVITKNDAGTNQFTVYVDGVQVVQDTATIADTDLKGSNGFTLLSDGQNNVRATSPSTTDSSKLQATLSNWSVHSEVLSANAVKQLYSNGHVRNIKNLPGVTASAIEAWWQLNDQTNPEQDLIGSNTLQYQDGNSPAKTLTDPTILLDADGATLVQDSINGNAMTLSLTKSFNFTTNEWVETADQDTALCLSFNGFEEQAEHVALWKCSQVIAGKSIDIADGGWHNVILSYRGNNDLAGNNVAEGDAVKFGPGPAQNLPFNWTISFDGEPLTAIKDGSGADYIDGLGPTLTDTYNSVSYNVGFNIYNRHMRYETSNTEEEYKPHAQFSAGIHEATGVDNNNAFQGSVDETSFHSDCWWVDQAGTSVLSNSFNQEKPATIYGNTTALSDRGAGTKYPVGVPYPLTSPDEIGSARGGNQWINPYRKGEVQEDTNVSIGGVEGWWRWGDTPGDCSVTINDVKDHDDSINARDIDAFGIVTEDRQDMSNNVESIYNEDIASGSATGSVAITFPQIVVSSIQAGICNLKQISSPLLKYLRVKFTGAGSCDLGSSSTQAQINFRSKE